HLPSQITVAVAAGRLPSSPPRQANTGLVGGPGALGLDPSASPSAALGASAKKGRLARRPPHTSTPASKLPANYFAFSPCESVRGFLASKVKADLPSW